MNTIVMKSRENIINLGESSITIDSQSVKTIDNLKKGFDGHKRVK